MIDQIERGTKVEVTIFKKIPPSQIFTDFYGDYRGRISIFDLDWSIPLALKKFSKIIEGERLECVVLNVDHENKIVELAVKFLFENISSEIGWDRILVGNQYQAKIVEVLNHFVLLRISENFFGLMPKEHILETSPKIRVKIIKKDGYNNLLYVVRADADIEFLEENDDVYNKSATFIDEDSRSFLAFKKSMIGSVATDEETQVIKDAFNLDKNIFSKIFQSGKMLYLQFSDIKNTFDNDFLGKAVPYFASEIVDIAEKQKVTLAKLSSQKYWFKINGRNNDQLDEFSLFNNEILIYGKIVEEKGKNDFRFEINKLEIENRDGNASNIKKRALGFTNVFLFADELKILSRYSFPPIDYNQKSIVELAIQKTKSFEIREQLKLKKGVLLQSEAKTLEINDKFLEFQIDKLRNEIRPSVTVHEFDRIPSDEIGLALKLSSEIADALEIDSVATVNVKVEDAKSFRGVLTIYQDDCILKFKENINLKLLRKGFEIETSISTSQIDVQRSIIHDFLTRKINIQHFEKVLIKKSNIATPTIKQIKFINSDLKQTELDYPESSQLKAVKKATGNQNIFLIQGPPGTGKTTVIAEIIEQLVKSGEKILVSGQNHVAVDNVLLKLAKNPRLNLLRVGNVDKIDDKVVQYNVDNMINSYREEYQLFLSNQLFLLSSFIDLKSKNIDDSHLKLRFNLLVDDITKNYDKLRVHFRDKHFNFYQGITNLNLYELNKIKKDFEEWINEDIEIIDLLVKPIVYKDVNVVFATCIGIKGDDVFQEADFKFDTVIVDEAGKANITETLVPMELGKKVILVGDQKQLPPYIDSSLLDIENSSSFPNSLYGNSYQLDEIKHATETSFFEFLINRINSGDFPSENLELLNFQHRMHPNIGEFVSKSFYDGEVKMGHGTSNHTLVLKAPFNKEIIFFDTSNVPDSYETKENFAVWNNIEADILIEHILPNLQGQILKSKEIAIIAPYKSQVALIKKKIRESEEPFFSNIDIATLDSFQGKEYDVIIFSFTRAADHSKPQYINGKKVFVKVGFLDDARRLNVAFSRAKKKLILIGNAKTLTDRRSHYDFLFNYTSLFLTLVELAKEEEKGNFINVADNYNFETPFNKFISKYKKGSVVNSIYKHRLDNIDGSFILFFKIDGFDCALMNYKISNELLLIIQKLNTGEKFNLKVDSINYTNERVSLCTLDYVSVNTVSKKIKNNLSGVSIGNQFKGQVIFLNDHGYIIKLKEDLTGFLKKNEIKKIIDLKIHDVIYVKIKNINRETNKVNLKL